MTASEFIESRITLRPRIAVVLGSGLGDFADRLEESEGDSLQRNTWLAALDCHRPCRQAGGGRTGWPAGSRARRPRSSVRRLHGAAGGLWNSRAFQDRRRFARSHQRGGRHQSRLPAGATGVDCRSHQSARTESSDRPERRSPGTALPRYDRGVFEAVSRDGARGWERDRTRSGRGRVCGGARTEL